MQKFLRFLSYHNAVPIAFSILILGGTGTFAATNPETIVNTTETVISVDNTYIANKDLSNYNPRIVIQAVTEDTENYYVAYSLETIGLQDAVWKDLSKANTLTVAKGLLGQYGDLGLYATQQLKQVVDHEVAFLKEVQEIERKSISQKTVATEYGGLIGKFLDTTTETLPGYTPVVTPPVVASNNPDQSAAAGSGDTSQPQAPQTSSVSSASQGSLSLQLMGNNPARVPIRHAYIDLGVFMSDPETDDIAVIEEWVDGVHVQSINVDTSEPRTYTITYKAHDALGNRAEVTRTVEVYDPNPPVIAPVEATSTPEVASSTEAVEDTGAPTQESGEETTE